MHKYKDTEYWCVCCIELNISFTYILKGAKGTTIRGKLHAVSRVNTGVKCMPQSGKDMLGLIKETLGKIII